MRTLVAGGCGFIGANLVHSLVESDVPVVTLDSLGYSAAPETVKLMKALPKHELVVASICDSAAIEETIRRFRPTTMINLAAATHVDRSIDNPSEFIHSNIIGVFTLLEVVRNYLRDMPAAEKNAFRFVHVSTDEVFGSIDAGTFDLESPHRPSSPYAASKAAAEDLVRAWHTTYGIPAIVTNCTNNYGPYQFPEKLIPHMVLRALGGMVLPIYGDGCQRRDWLHVSDHVAALRLIGENGNPGRTYTIGGGNCPTNLEIVHRVCSTLDEIRPREDGRPHAEMITHVEDRPGHDRRYALDTIHIRDELGFTPRVSLDDGLRETVRWYIENEKWWRPLINRNYKLERLGKGECGV